MAADKGGSVVGTSTAQMSKRLAERAALKRCREMGGKNCEVSFSYENQCVAVALLSGEMVSDAVMSYVSAATVDEAKAKSLRNCSEGNGGGICEVGYSNCTAPVLIR
nr:DUF4189 domain-containing protein [Xanthomonas sp. XNM01]